MLTVDNEDEEQQNAVLHEDIDNDMGQHIDHSGSQNSSSAARQINANKVIVIFLVAACVAAIAFAALWASARVPSDAAAKVDDAFVSESSVADYINQYRINNSLTDDADFAQALLSQNLNISTFRQNCINQLALNELIADKAAELGVVPSEEDIDKQYEAMKSQMSFDSDEIWAETLEEKGMSEESLKEQISTNLAEQNIYEKEVPKRDATDDETLEFVHDNAAGQELKHSYRIVFTGDDAMERAKECYERIKSAGDELNADSFSGFALAYSEEDDVQDTGGSYVWSDSSDASQDYLDILNDLEEGEYSEPSTVEDDDEAVEIVYCDEDYVFPSDKIISSLKLSDLSNSVKDHVAEKASDSSWNTDCKTYLSKMLSNAKITYYPVPDGAAYNVDLTQASSSSADGSSEDGD